MGNTIQVLEQAVEEAKLDMATKIEANRRRIAGEPVEQDHTLDMEALVAKIEAHRRRLVACEGVAA